MSLILGTNPKDGLEKLKNMIQHWEFCYGQNIPENLVFVGVHANGSKTEYTFKEVHARQQCLAAFLIKQGVQKSEPVVIIAENTPLSILSSISVTYSGAAVSMLPADIPQRHLVHINKILAPKVVIFTSYKLFKRFRDSLKLSENKQIALVWTDPQDEILESDQIITAEIAIEIGKNFWREEVTLLRSVRESVTANDICSIEWNRDSKNNFYGYFISHNNYLKAIIRWLDTFEFPQKSHVGLLKSPAEPHLKMVGVYAAISYFNVVWFLKISPLTIKLMTKENIKLILSSGTGANLLATWIANRSARLNWLSKKIAQTGFNANAHYSRYLDKQLSPPLGVKMQRWLSYHYILRKIKQEVFGKKDIVLITNNLKLRSTTQLLLESVGIQTFVGSAEAAVAGFWAINTPSARRINSVGKVLKEIQYVLKLDQEEKSNGDGLPVGKIFLKGDIIPEKTWDYQTVKESVAISGKFYIQDGFLFSDNVIQENTKK